MRSSVFCSRKLTQPLISFLCFAFLCSGALAGVQHGAVKSIVVDATVVKFELAGVEKNEPACNIQHSFVVSRGSQMGRAAQSFLNATQVSKAEITIVGTGHCSVSPGYEDVGGAMITGLASQLASKPSSNDAELITDVKPNVSSPYITAVCSAGKSLNSQTCGNNPCNCNGGTVISMVTTSNADGNQCSAASGSATCSASACVGTNTTGSAGCCICY